MGVMVCGRAKREKEGIAEATSAAEQPSSQALLISFNSTREEQSRAQSCRSAVSQLREECWKAERGQIECGEGKTRSQWIFW